jgi:hypothetical protein
VFTIKYAKKQLRPPYYALVICALWTEHVNIPRTVHVCSDFVASLALASALQNQPQPCETEDRGTPYPVKGKAIPVTGREGLGVVRHRGSQIF